MKILILGSGLLGVTSAYYLGQRGHEVEIVDRQPESGRETSFANGGQLSYSHAEPWANPEVLPKVFKWMFKDDAPLVMRFNTDPHMIRWGLQFLRNCTRERSAKSSISLLKLGLYSKAKMAEIIADTGIQFDHLDKGILHVFDDRKAFDHAVEQAEFQKRHGCEETPMSYEECVKLEPALQHVGKHIVGGMHAPIDETGDAHTFANEMAKYCETKFGTKIHYKHEVTRINSEGDRIRSITTNKGDMKADAYVMSLGSYSSVYLRQVGINVPIYPMKGYSVTLPANEFSPTVSVTDDALKIVYSRLGNRLRVAGTAESARYNTRINEVRVDAILRGIKSLFPRVSLSDISTWACLRPSTPDGPPIIGNTRYSNLFMNTGHGTLGWTQAAGSGRLLADIIDRKPTEIATNGLTIERYK